MFLEKCEMPFVEENAHSYAAVLTEIEDINSTNHIIFSILNLLWQLLLKNKDSKYFQLHYKVIIIYILLVYIMFIYILLFNMSSPLIEFGLGKRKKRKTLFLSPCCMQKTSKCGKQFCFKIPRYFKNQSIVNRSLATVVVVRGHFEK